jgi:hypothetical protein
MFDPEMPFTVAAALEAGMTHEELHAGFTRVIEGVYIAARVRVSARIKARAALLIHPAGAVVSHDSVLRMLGAPVALSPEEHVTVARPRDRRFRRGVRPHAMALRVKDVGDFRGIPATVPERTFVDVAGRLPLVELVVLGDWLVRHGHTTTHELVAFCAESPARYAVRALEAARFVRDRVDSPQESRTRMLLVLAGLPEPDVGETIRDDDGTPLTQIDMLYLLARTGSPPPATGGMIGLAVDYDGLDHLKSRERWEKDAERADAFTDRRLQHLRVTATGLNRNAEHTLRRVHAALKALGWPGLEPLGDDWRPHFER